MADLVLRGGRVVTLDPARPEAEALAIEGDRIVAVGRDDEIAPWIGKRTRILDLRGGLAVPGLTEGHAHLLNLGRLRLHLDLSDCRSMDDLVARVREAAARTPRGQWIYGRGWHQEKWSPPPVPSVEGFPVHHVLSAAVAEHPVLLTHASGHASLVNAQAMARAGIDAATPDPPGGRILRDARGQPTGVLIETAEALAESAYERDQAARPAEAIARERERMLELAMEECVRKGLTAFHDAGSGVETIGLLRRMADEGRLRLRLYVMVREPNHVLEAELPRLRMVGYGGGFLTVRAIKKAADGALGARGAWLLEPYADAPGTHGENTESLDSIERAGRLAIEHGFQLCVHAIGDRANREVLDLYERLSTEHPEARELRWRIEHAQHLHPEDIPRFGRLGVIASVQTVHCTSDGPWAIGRIGERRAREGAYAWRALLDSGARLINGTDAPVEDVDPIRNFYAAVTRRMADGRAFFPEQRLGREEALRAATTDAAYAAFEEDRRGSLAPGKWADITVLSQDILTVPEEVLLRTEVLYTIVGGRVAYARD